MYNEDNDNDSYVDDSYYNQDSEFEEYEPTEEYENDQSYDPASEVVQQDDDVGELFETVEDDQIINHLPKKLEEPDYYDEPADSGFLDIQDPFTGKKIQTQRDQDAFLNKYTQAVLKNAGLPKNYLDNRIKNHPTVLLATKVIEKYETELSNQKFINELNELKTIVPEVNEMEDLFKLKNFRQFFKNYYGNVKIDKKGNPIGNPQPKMTMKQAYLLANYNTLVENKTRASKQAVINNIRTKSHLSTLKNNKSGSYADIPPETLELYKHLLPGLKMKDYMKHFIADQKENY